jgi:hypothetical protein
MPTALVSPITLSLVSVFSKPSHGQRGETGLWQRNELLLLDPNELQNLPSKRRHHEKVIVTLACLLVAQLAFGQRTRQ